MMITDKTDMTDKTDKTDNLNPNWQILHTF